jgi:hypothetical protein
MDGGRPSHAVHRAAAGRISGAEVHVDFLACSQRSGRRIAVIVENDPILIEKSYYRSLSDRPCE